MCMRAIHSKFLSGLAVALVALSMGAGLKAQTQTSGPGPGINKRMIIRMGPGSFIFDRIVGGFGGKVVTGAPFSATVTRTMHQVLADGTTIDRTEMGSIARDSAGRTMREMTLPQIGPLSASGQVPHIVFIRDPVVGQGYILNENKRTALTVPLPAARGAIRLKMNAQFKANVQKQSLGTKTLDGLTVQGTLYTRTIPAGKIGNDRPIVITTEEWYSPQLQTVITRTRKDPRFGTTSYQMNNISLNEPPQSLFTVPSDYTPVHPRAMWRKGAPQGGQTPLPPQRPDVPNGN